jgi:membrane protease YdiL (CAAX protease family)
LIQTRLAGVLTQTEAWIVQAALFSVLHLSPLIFVTHFGMGLMLGWLRDWSKSIYPGMLLHAAWNAVVVVDELNLAL